MTKKNGRKKRQKKGKIRSSKMNNFKTCAKKAKLIDIL